MTTYKELYDWPLGTRVRFADQWDVFDTGIIPKGKTGTIVISDEDAIYVFIDDGDLREKFREWLGCVVFYAEYDIDNIPVVPWTHMG